MYRVGESDLQNRIKVICVVVTKYVKVCFARNTQDKRASHEFESKIQYIVRYFNCVCSKCTVCCRGANRVTQLLMVLILSRIRSPLSYLCTFQPLHHQYQKQGYDQGMGIHQQQLKQLCCGRRGPSHQLTWQS